MSHATPTLMPTETQTPGSPPDSGTLAQPAVRETLTRVLARQGRSTLARVELAASELMRFGSGPAIAERLETIREAAGEIDVLLGKIDLLAGPRRIERWPAIELGAVWRVVLARLAPTLSARGLEVRIAAEAARPPRVALPQAPLEAMLCAFVRLLIPLAEGLERIELRIDEVGGAVRVAAVADRASQASRYEDPPMDRDALIEFEVLLAEWGGALQREAASVAAASETLEPAGRSWVFWLPEAEPDA